MGKSSSVTVGYEYFMGLHFGVCYGPVDALKRIVVGKRIAWQGNVTENEQIEIDADDLFGGKKREGGIEGDLDVMMGGPAQGINDYLADHIEGLLPAFRGILSLVYRGGLISANNPYVKPWAFQVTRILQGWDGGEAWYPEKASTGFVSCTGPLALYFALDSSGSMGELTSNGETRLTNLKTAVKAVMDFILADIVPTGIRVDIAVTAWGTQPGVRETTSRRTVDASDISYLKGFVDAMSHEDGFWTYFPAGLLDVEDFLAGAPEDSEEAGHIVFLITDGEPSTSNGSETAQEIAENARAIIDANPTAKCFAVNIDLEDTTYTAIVDNTPGDGVPVVDGGDPEALKNIILNAIQSYEAMNPAHIIYQCLTDPMWGMGYPTSQIDSDNFEAAADTFFDEQLGLCFLWNQQSSIQDFVQEVLDHAGAVLYADPKTGKFKLKALRNDYDPDELTIYDESSIISMDSFERPGYGDTINEIVVVFRDQCSGENTSIAVQDLANIQAQGGVVSQTRQYPGIPNHTLAARTAERDLVAASTPLAKCKITVNRKGWQEAPGGVIKVSWAKHGLTEVIFRVLAINYGTLENGQIVIDLAEDVYSLPESSYSKQEPGGFTPPQTKPEVITIQDVLETPYWDIARALTAADLSFVDPDAAFIMGVAASQNRVELGFEMYTRVSPNEYVSADGVGTFAPYATLSSDGLSQTDDVIQFDNGLRTDRVQPGWRALIGSGRDAEFVEVVELDSTGGYVVNRGILDTTPQVHAGGASIFFNEIDFAVDPTERATGEMVDVKLAAFSSSGSIPVSSAIEMTIEPDQRFYRPYPPGKIRINDLDFPTETDPSVLVTWAHRDRLQQLANYVDQEEASIGPEAGTTYNVYYYLDDVLVHTDTGISGTTAPGYVYLSLGTARVEIESQRNSVTSWQRQIREFELDNNDAGFKVIPVDNAKVSGSNTNFPALIKPSVMFGIGTLTLAQAQSSRFYADEAKTTELAREVVSADEIWVKVPTMASGTSIYMDWDGVRSDYAVTDTYGARAAWNSNYQFVSHNGGGADSTSNAHSGTGNGGITIGGITGKIGVGTNFDGSNDYIAINTLATVSTAIPVTWSCWFNRDTQPAGSQVMMSSHQTSGNLNRSQTFMNATDLHVLVAGASVIVTSVGALLDTWHHVAVTADGSGNIVIYLDGAQINTGSGASTQTADRFSVGQEFDSGPTASDFWDGFIDDVRISNVALSAGWILTSYNNQNDPASFWDAASDP